MFSSIMVACMYCYVSVFCKLTCNEKSFYVVCVVLSMDLVLLGKPYAFQQDR